MSKFFKRKSQIKATAKEPRALDEITREYAALSQKSGEVQYTIYALSQDLEQLNQAILRLNHEGAERKKLNASAAIAEEKKEV